jgi:hypothetical protein
MMDRIERIAKSLVAVSIPRDVRRRTERFLARIERSVRRFDDWDDLWNYIYDHLSDEEYEAAEKLVSQLENEFGHSRSNPDEQSYMSDWASILADEWEEHLCLR